MRTTAAYVSLLFLTNPFDIRWCRTHADCPRFYYCTPWKTCRRQTPQIPIRVPVDRFKKIYFTPINL